MLQKAAAVPPAPRLFDPAKDAARLLGWFGMMILMVGAPLLSVLSRRAIYVLLPIGASVLMAAVFITVSRDGFGTTRTAMRQPIGLAVLFLLGWMGLSIVWTPFPGAALPHYAATVVILALAAFVVAYLPERRAGPTLYLLPAGVAIAGTLTLAMVFFGPTSFRGGSEFDVSLLERSVLTIVVLVWPALGALAGFGRFLLAVILAILVADIVVVAQTPLAMAAFMLGAVAFAATGTAPRRVARVAIAVYCGLAVVAPLLPFVLAPLAAVVPNVGRGTIAAMQDWRGLVADDPARLVTGHGLDLARYGVYIGFLPAHTPRSILFEIWYDLGLLGAGAFALVVALALAAAANAAAFVAPALIAGIVATLSIAYFGVATAELWFITLASLQAIGFGLLARSSRDARPVATVLGTLPAAIDEQVPGTAETLLRL